MEFIELSGLSLPDEIILDAITSKKDIVKTGHVFSKEALKEDEPLYQEWLETTFRMENFKKPPKISFICLPAFTDGPKHVDFYRLLDDDGKVKRHLRRVAINFPILGDWKESHVRYTETDLKYYFGGPVMIDTTKEHQVMNGSSSMDRIILSVGFYGDSFAAIKQMYENHELLR